MPMPEGAQLDFGFNPILTNVGINLLTKLTDFVGTTILPTVPVASSTGTYNVWKAGDFLRRNGKRIANYEAVPLAGFATGQGTYAVVNWGLGTPYTAQDLARARRGGMTDQQFKNLKSKFVTTQGVLEQEFRVQALFQTTGNWTTTYAGVNSGPTGNQFVRWDQAAATPVDDVMTWKRVMRLLSGYEPNSFIIPEKIMLALYKNAQIQDRVKVAFTGTGGQPIQISKAHVEALFGLSVQVPLAMYNSAAEGQTDVLVEIWTQTTMWLGYIAPAPSIEEPSAAYNFAWTGDTTDGLPQGIGTGEGPQTWGSAKSDKGLFVRDYIDVPKGCRVIEGTIWSSPNVTAAVLGCTFTATIN